MSLILDALKRSESERIAKTQDANSLVTSGISTGNDTNKSIPWLPFLIAAVIINLVILAVVLKSNNNDATVANNINETNKPALNPVVNHPDSSGQSHPEQTVNSGPRLTLEMPTRAEMPPPREVKAATALAEELLAEPQSARPAYGTSDNNIPTPAVLANAAPAVPADFAMIETEEVKPATTAAPEDPVALKELNNAGLADQLSNYEINTHIFNSSDASRSFVLINMEKYREGDTLQGSNFTISSITNEGVVINHDAGQVLLSNN